jgi:hypothetical protein
VGTVKGSDQSPDELLTGREPALIGTVRVHHVGKCQEVLFGELHTVPVYGIEGGGLSVSSDGQGQQTAEKEEVLTQKGVWVHRDNLRLPAYYV